MKKKIFFLTIILLGAFLSKAQNVTQVTDEQVFNAFKQDLVKFGQNSGEEEIVRPLQL